MRYVLHPYPPMDDWQALLPDQKSIYENLHPTAALRNGLEQRMKSLGLALTIFTLTGALAALDLSGAHRVKAANQDAVQPKEKIGAQRAVLSLTRRAVKIEANREANPAVIDAFLVMPLFSPQTRGNTLTELRYD